MSRKRQIPEYTERVLLEEIRFARHFTMKKIARRYGITVWSLSNYIRRATAEGRL